jgi:hypothetical protein
MTAKYLIITGSCIFLVLGTIHLVYTFFTDKFLTRNSETGYWMKKDFPVLTKDTTVWKAWIGFNASHSAGAIFIGLINIIIAIQYFELYQKAISLLILNDITVLFYLYVAKRYWFKIPLTGIFVTTICFISATIIILL